MNELLLVRHCASSSQSPDAPLSEAGLQQAELLSDFLAPFSPDHIVSSPFRRALQTIAPLAERTGLAVRHEPRLAERELSGAPLDDWPEQLRRTWEDFDYRAPGGETSREAQRRGREAFDEIAVEGHRCPLLVTHGNLLGLLIHTIDPSFDHAAWGALTNLDVFAVRIRGTCFSVERVWPGT